RMQVSMPSLQHEVMIEAVENHNPEVIVIDEIGRELEAAAARTIAERGVQLIGTAHGNTLENLLLNPTLSDLIGGIESVTLSDEEARRRGTQKTVLERRSAPTFDVLIEIQTRDRLAVHPDVADAVDSLLRGYPSPPEIRARLEDGKIVTERASVPSPKRQVAQTQGFRRSRDGDVYAEVPPGEAKPRYFAEPQDTIRREKPLQAEKIYPYGVARNRLIQAAKRLGVPVLVVNDIGEADTLVTLRSYYRKRQRPVVDAENRGMPIYVLRSNTVNQMQQFLSDLFNLTSEPTDEISKDRMLEETKGAINAILNGERWIELPPADAYIRRLQHEMARRYHLTSHSYGKEPHRRVRIYRE
ncbi:MAG: R3H domain-containing nucleic acid-binding protein, partial [Anaerolineales bacterium]